MVDIEAGKRISADLTKALEEGGAQVLVDLLRSLPIALVGKSTCAYSLEANSSLAAASANAGGTDIVSTFWVDSMPKGAAIHTALKQELKQNTVPYVFINGEFVGGCDDIKKLHAAGTLAPKLYAAASDHGLGSRKAKTKSTDIKTASPLEKDIHSDQGSHSEPIVPDENFIDPNFKPVVADGEPQVYLPLFYFPEIVDSNVIRLTAIQVVILCIIGIAARKHLWSHYLILGLVMDCLARLFFGPGPSPLGQLARCVAVFLKPSFRPGVPKQFAVFCGTFMAVVAATFLFTSGFDPEEVIPSIVLAVYAFLSLLEFSIDFCMGCVMFGWMVKFHILPKEVYNVGISSKPEAEYTYAEATKWLDLPECEIVRMSYPGKPPSSIDVRYKTKSNDHDRQSFNVVKHVKILHFQVVLAVFGLAVLWRVAAMPIIGTAAGMNVSHSPGDAFAIIGTITYGIFGLLYLAKLFKYPRKVAKEWMDPLRSNAFVIPPASLVLIAIVILGRFDGADTLAKVLFWIGAPITLALTFLLAARWITDLHSQEHVNPGWLFAPTASFVCALTGPMIDIRYTEASYLWFAAAVALSIPLYVITFHKAVIFNEPDDRNRHLKWTWVAAPAVACAAQVVLSAATALPVSMVDFNGASSLPFDFTSRVLYCIALSLGFILGLLFVTGHSSRIRFDPSASWTIAFPLEALALATIFYASAIRGTLTNGMAYAALAVPTWTVLVLTLHSVHSILMKGFFTMDVKYGPLSQQIITHEAFRAGGERLKAAVAALDPGNSGKANPFALADLALQFRRYRLVHSWHAHQEDSVIFKEFETYVPGLAGQQRDEHEEHHAAMARWALCIETLESEAGSNNPNALETLKTQIPAFVDEFERHLCEEEANATRGGRKHLSFDLQKDMLRRMWNGTPIEVLTEFLPYIVNNLPMQQQRVKFVRCWATWGLPDRAQLIGRMIAMGVDSHIWARLIEDVPEIAPRGEPRWRRYY